MNTSSVLIEHKTESFKKDRKRKISIFGSRVKEFMITIVITQKYGSYFVSLRSPEALFWGGGGGCCTQPLKKMDEGWTGTC